MQIEVKLYAIFRDPVPEEAQNIFLLLDLPEDMPKISAVSGRIVDEGCILKDGDIVSIFPPIAGG